MAGPPSKRADLRDAALAVLRGNDLGDWTKPAPRLYPHQWSWDSAFIAIGLVHVDVERALRELESLFRGQWADGRVPHIVFNPEAADYFPGPDRWASAASSSLAPRQPATSGLIQPPVHALALQRIVTATDSLRGRLEQLYVRVLDWHRYLARARDPHQRGMLLIYHPWESGTDNSPRWDDALDRIHVGDLAPYTRSDVTIVGDATARPTNLEYDRYLWLVELLKGDGYDDGRIHQHYPFLVGDVLMSAIFAAACQALAEVAIALRRPPAERDELLVLARRFADGVQHAWDADLSLALDRDERAGAAVRVETCAGLAPLLLPGLADELRDAVLERLEGAGFAGAPGLVEAVIPSTAPASGGFQVRRYWRGPAWPVANWLFWWALRQHGQLDAARRLREANLALLQRPGARFAEYFEPYTGEPLGSLDQSWTAAVALDWLASATSEA